jgi:hypothetical protein
VEFGMFLDRAWDVLVILKEKLTWWKGKLSGRGKFSSWRDNFCVVKENLWVERKTRWSET